MAVTGASGYIAGHVVRLLQARGFHVRGTVRSLRDAAKVQHLLDDFPGLELFEADLLAPGSFDACFAGCVGSVLRWRGARGGLAIFGSSWTRGLRR